VDGQHSVVLGAADVDTSPSVGPHGDALPGAGGTALGAGDDIAVGAARETRLQGAVQVVEFFRDTSQGAGIGGR